MVVICDRRIRKSETGGCHAVVPKGAILSGRVVGDIVVCHICCAASIVRTPVSLCASCRSAAVAVQDVIHENVALSVENNALATVVHYRVARDDNAGRVRATTAVIELNALGPVFLDDIVRN